MRGPRGGTVDTADLKSASGKPRCRFESGRGHHVEDGCPRECGVVLRSRALKFLVFLLKGVFDNRLRVLVPMRQAASIADPDGDLSPTENVPPVGPLAECDQLIACGDAAGL